MNNTLTADRLNNMFVALADETRRAILPRLSSGEARVTEVAVPFDISLNSVSKHIRILERAGFSGLHSLFHLVPVIGPFIVMAILAFGDWPNGEGRPQPVRS